MAASFSYAESMRIHAMRKLWQRRGIALAIPEYKGLCEAIAAGLCELVTCDDIGQPVYLVKIRGAQVYAVWSQAHRAIRTFLPCERWIGRVNRSKRRRGLECLNAAY